MDDSFTPPTEVLAFLVRTIAPRDLWQWLSEDDHLALRQRVARGFRATAEVLRQPAARTRLVSHLESNPGDFTSLLHRWGAAPPPALKEVSSSGDSLLTNLASLQMKYGPESLLLALLHEGKEEAIEALANAADDAEAVEELQNNDEVSSPDSSDQIEKLSRLNEREKQKAQRWHDKWRETHSRAEQTERTLRTELHESQKNLREAQRQQRAESNKAVLLEEKLNEALAGRERAERRTKALQPQLEAAQTEYKTARRQLQRLQQINEELRGQLKAAEAQTLSELGSETPQTKKTADAPTNIPAARPATTPDATSKIVAAIDGNNEAFVSNLRRDLEALRSHDDKAFRAFLKRLKTAGKYYESVLTRPVARVLVDASNVARYDTTKKGKLSYLLSMREELRRHNCFPIVFVADASLPYQIDDSKALRIMAKQGELIITTSGQQADEVLARQARATGAYVVTNDKNFHYDFAPDFAPQRIGFRIVDGMVLLEDFS